MHLEFQVIDFRCWDWIFLLEHAGKLRIIVLIEEE
jgi:hypothetical protein